MFFAFASSQANAQEKSKFDKWPELKAFHEVISQTFHPSEEGNLKPIKERSGELAEKAMNLSKSKIPAELSTKEIINAANKLQVDTKKLDEMVKSKASDEKITKALNEVHKTFHLIVEKCMHPEGEKGKGKEEHHE